MPLPLVAIGLGIARAVAIMLAYEIGARTADHVGIINAPTLTDVYQNGVAVMGAEDVQEKRVVAAAAGFVTDVLNSGDAMVPHNRKTGERLPMNYFHMNLTPGGNGQMWFTPQYYSKKSLNAKFKAGQRSGEFRERRKIAQSSQINNPPS